MRALCLINRSSGILPSGTTDAELERIRAALAAASIEAEMVAIEGADLQRSIDRLRDGSFDAVIVGGGDGTLNAVAAAVAGTRTILGVLPLGTHNHFAKDLGIPTDLDAALASFATAEARSIDVAEVNGRPFLNFSGVGFHPMIVKHREAQRHVRGRWKFVAMFVAVFRNLRTLRLRRTRIDDDRRTVRCWTASVIVCNNVHQMGVFGVTGVSCARRGVLNLYLARATRWWQYAWLLVLALFRSLDRALEFEVLVSSRFDVATRGRTVRVSIDGEVVDLAVPLRYRIRRDALRVLVPAGASAGIRSDSPATDPGNPVSVRGAAPP